MNKKTNTILFVLLGTLLNLFLMVGIFIFLLVLIGFFLGGSKDSSMTLLLVFIGIIALSLGGSFFLYSRIVRFAFRKWNLEERIHPIFPHKRRY